MADRIYYLYVLKEISIKRIVLNYNIPLCENTIKTFLEFNNIEIRSDIFYQEYNYNTLEENFFDNIDSEEKAYWLGFIMADGCITQRSENSICLSISLARKDKAHLKKFLNSLKCDAPIRDYLVTGKYEASSIKITNLNLGNSLIDKGIIPRKTYFCKFPNIDKQYHLPFIRGVFDGDGSIKISKGISVVGTEELIRAIGKILEVNEKYIYKNEKSKNLFEIATSKRSEVYRILELLYGEANIYLDRKYKRYLSYKQYYENKFLK